MDEFDIKKPIVARVEDDIRSLTERLFCIVHDVVQGRMAVPVGTGEVQICVGHYIKHDPATGKRSYVPAYRTHTF